MATFQGYPVSGSDKYTTARGSIIRMTGSTVGEVITRLQLIAHVNCTNAVDSYKVVLYKGIPHDWDFEETGNYKYYEPNSSAENRRLFYSGNDNIASNVMSYEYRIVKGGGSILCSWTENTSVSTGEHALIMTSPALFIPVDSIGIDENIGVIILANRDINGNTPTFKLIANSYFTVLPTTATIPSGTVSIKSIYASKNGTKIDEPIGGIHDLFVQWSYDANDANEYNLTIVKSNIDEFVFSKKLSSTSYTVPSSYLSAGETYYAVVTPVNAAGYGTAGISLKITFYSFSLQSAPNSISYKDGSGNNISATTTTSGTITASWDNAVVYNSGGKETSYPLRYYFSNSNSSSWSSERSKTFSNLAAGNSITFYELKIAIYDSNTASYIEVGSYDFPDKTISIIAATSVTGPTITKTLTQYGKVYKASATFNISGNEATIATLGYYSGDTLLENISVPIQNKVATFTFYAPGKIVTELKFSLNGLSFSYEGLSTTETEIPIEPLSFPMSWGITAPSAVGLSDNSVLQKTLTITAGQFDNPIDKKHSIKLTLSQENKAVQVLYNDFLTSGTIYSLSRGNSIFSYFSENTNITLNYEIINVDPTYNLNENSSTTNMSGTIAIFKIVPAVTFSAAFDEGSLEIYNLEIWKNKGEFSSNTKEINFTINIPDGVPKGGIEVYSIESVSNELKKDGVTISTQPFTTIGRATIVVRGKYSVDETEYLNDTQEIYLTIIDSRPPYIPNFTLAFSNLSSVENYYIPNYSSFTVSGLTGIKFKNDTVIKEISFHFCLDEAAQGQATTLTGIPSGGNYLYPNDKIPLDIFYNSGNSTKKIGLLVTVVSSDGKSNKRLVTSTYQPAYIPLPSFNFAEITNEKVDEEAEVTAWINYKYNLLDSSIKEDNNLFIKETSILYDTSAGKKVDELNQESDYQVGEISYNNSFSVVQPTLGYVLITLQIYYNDKAILSPITKKVGFSTDVGEIAIRKKQVGILTEPANNSIFTIGNNMGVEHFIAFIGTTGDTVGYITLGTDRNGNEQTIFSAGKWE